MVGNLAPAVAVHGLLWRHQCATDRELCPTQVQPLPAFIEWDVTGTNGPILHPLPPPEAAALPPTSGKPLCRSRCGLLGNPRGMKS